MALWAATQAHEPSLFAAPGLVLCGSMARTTITFTMSLPPEMATELDETMAREHRTRSELVREALRRYFRSNAKDRSFIESLRAGQR